MALWREITREALAGDVWLQVRQAAGDPLAGAGEWRQAEAALPLWRRAVRQRLGLMRRGEAGPIQLGIVWHQYRAAQQRARVWWQTLGKPD